MYIHNFPCKPHSNALIKETRSPSFKKSASFIGLESIITIPGINCRKLFSSNILRWFSGHDLSFSFFFFFKFQILGKSLVWIGCQLLNSKTFNMNSNSHCENNVFKEKDKDKIGHYELMRLSLTSWYFL